MFWYAGIDCRRGPMASVTDRATVSAAPSPWVPQPPDFRFSTDDFPEADRIAIFREIVGKQLLRQEMEPHPDHRFYVHGTARPFPGRLFAVWSSGSPHSIRRTRDLLSDGDDGLLFQWTTSSRFGEHLGREVALGPGDAILFSCAETRSITLPSAFETITIKVPRSALAPLLRDTDSCLGRPVPGNSTTLRLLLRYLEVLREELPSATRELQDLAVAHVYDLLAIVFGATRDASEAARRRGARAARLVAIKADIDAHLEDTCFSIAVLAARHGMTPRSLQMLFEEEGATFTEFLRAQRLSRARRMLVSRRFDGYRIIDIALACGFSDVSYFNRMFRARYDATPSDIRAARAGKDVEAT